MADQPINILYIDDNKFDRELVRDALEQDDGGFQLTGVANQAQLEAALQAENFALVLSDFNVLGLSGLEILDIVHSYNPQLPVIIVTGTGTEEVAVEAMKRGVADYVIKTLHHLKRLPATIRTALARQALVEENERAERALQLSEAKYRSLLETASAAIIILDHTGHITMVNPQTEAMFGYDQAALLGQPLTRLISDLPTQPGSILALPDDLFRLEAETDSTLIALTGRHQSGRTFPIEVSLSHTETQDGLLSMCFINDITERKQAEQHVRASLAEKEVLLREIHHRVKNNLQIISSLLDLQSSHILDKETLQVLRESQNRVRSMALIHEMLYQAEGFARIDFAAYVERLGHHLFNSFDLRGRSIKLNVEISPIKFNLDTAITCGLILNELISNCLKHAFPQKQVGQIRVAVQTDLPDQYQLIVQDNGVGLPGTEALQQSATIGLKLVETLVSKLKGKLTIDRHEGTTFVIHFPKVEQD